MNIIFKGDISVARLDGMANNPAGLTFRCYDSGALKDNTRINHGDFVSWDGTKWVLRPDLSYLLDDSENSIQDQIDDITDLIPDGTTTENQLVNAVDLSAVEERVTTAEGDIDSIEGKIPSGASSSNKLVTESDLEAAQDRWQTGFTPKGEATVSAINALTTQSNGDQYIVTDSGTITAGSISEVAGDTVAWNATDEVWYKVNQYVTKTEFEEYKDALDGTAKSDSVTKEYDPDAGVGEGGYCMNEGHLYQANEMMSGDFDATKCTKKEVYEVLMQQIEQQKIMLSAIESQQTNLERPEGYIPDVGDAVWVGDDGKKHFFKGDTVNASSLTSAGLTFVGVVSF